MKKSKANQKEIPTFPFGYPPCECGKGPTSGILKGYCHGNPIYKKPQSQQLINWRSFKGGCGGELKICCHDKVVIQECILEDLLKQQHNHTVKLCMGVISDSWLLEKAFPDSTCNKLIAKLQKLLTKNKND